MEFVPVHVNYADICLDWASLLLVPHLARGEGESNFPSKGGRGGGAEQAVDE